MSEENTVDIDNLLDATLDDLEDLPTFEPFPAGAHRVKISLETKEVNDHPSVEANCVMMETLELSNATSDTAPKEGSTANCLYMLDNEFGRGAFKAIAKPLGEALNVASPREVIEQTKDIEVLIVTTIKHDKKNDVNRMNIKELQVV